MIKAAFMFTHFICQLSSCLFFGIRRFFCLIISAFKHHTNTGCYFTSSALSTKNEKQHQTKAQKCHTSCGDTAQHILPGTTFTRRGQRAGGGPFLFNGGRPGGTFSIPMLQHRGPFEFPRWLLQTPALPPFSINGEEHLFSRRLLHSLCWKLRRKCFLQISFSQRYSAFAD